MTESPFTRTEYGVPLFIYPHKGYYMIQAGTPYSDTPIYFDAAAFGTGKIGKRELRNALRRYARLVRRMANA